jgi:hypothetical protein
MTRALYDANEQVQEEATREFRKLLSIGLLSFIPLSCCNFDVLIFYFWRTARSPPINKVIDAGAIPRFVEFLTESHRPALQFEAAWALTNIVSGTSDQTKCVVDNGAVAHFVELMASPVDSLREQVVFHRSHSQYEDLPSSYC